MPAESNAELMTDYLDDALEGGEAESFAKLLADSPEATLTVEQFLRTGVVETFCDGACDPG